MFLHPPPAVGSPIVVRCVCRKRETLTGDATIRYFDYLEGFDIFDGLLANLFTGVLPAGSGFLGSAHQQ